MPLREPCKAQSMRRSSRETLPPIPYILWVKAPVYICSDKSKRWENNQEMPFIIEGELGNRWKLLAKRLESPPVF